MAKINLDLRSFGVAPSDDYCADVRGPSSAGHVIPLSMRKKFIGDVTSKVVHLSKIYRVPRNHRLEPVK